MRLKYLAVALVAIVLLGLPLSVVLINSHDEALSTEVQKSLMRNPHYTLTQVRAYYYLIGLYSGATGDFEKAGQELWKQNSTPEFWSKLAQGDPWVTQFKQCPGGKCTVRSLDEKPELEEFLKTDKVALSKYIHLMEYGEGATLFHGNHKTPIAPISGQNPRMHQLFLLQLAQWLRQGGGERVMDLLISSNEYMRSYYGNGSASERLQAFANTLQNLNFLLVAVQTYPNLHLRPELIESIVVPDPTDLLFGALDTEVQMFENLSYSLSQAHGFEAFAFKPLQSVNRFYEIYAQAIATDCPLEHELSTCVPAAKWLEFKSLRSYFDNPMGRRWTSVFFTNAMPERISALKPKIKAMADLKAELRER